MKSLIVWIPLLVIFIACKIIAYKLKKKGKFLWKMEDCRNKEVYDFPFEVIKPEEV